MSKNIKPKRVTFRRIYDSIVPFYPEVQFSIPNLQSLREF